MSQAYCSFSPPLLLKHSHQSHFNLNQLLPSTPFLFPFLRLKKMNKKNHNFTAFIISRNENKRLEANLTDPPNQTELIEPSHSLLWNADLITEATSGQILNPGPSYGPVCTDTRKLKKGDWFIALSGPNFEAHDFLSVAAEKGCSGVVGLRMPLGWELGFVSVPDTLKALQNMAFYARRKLTCPVIAITGSCGKTSTKEMTALALSSLGQIHQTIGNMNNHIGVPLTLLNAPHHACACVLELGMNHLGEIAELAEICRPTMRVILNVGLCHVEGVGSLERVAMAKSELIQSAKKGDVCILNGDDAFVAAMDVPSGVKKIYFGYSENCGVRLMDAVTINNGLGIRVKVKVNEKVNDNFQPTNKPRKDDIIEVSIDSPGLHSAINVCAAIAIGVALNVPVDRLGPSLAKYVPPNMRLKVEDVKVPALTLTDGSMDFDNQVKSSGNRVKSSQLTLIRLIDDSYNSSPPSVLSALQLLLSMDAHDVHDDDDDIHDGNDGNDGNDDHRYHHRWKGRRIALLGEMHELGNFSESEHFNILKLCETEFRVDMVGLVGQAYAHAAAELASSGRTRMKVMTFETSAQLSEAVRGLVRACDVVLVKGSRKSKMEVVSEALRSLSC